MPRAKSSNCRFNEAEEVPHLRRVGHLLPRYTMFLCIVMEDFHADLKSGSIEKARRVGRPWDYWYALIMVMYFSKLYAVNRINWKQLYHKVFKSYLGIILSRVMIHRFLVCAWDISILSNGSRCIKGRFSKLSKSVLVIFNNWICSWWHICTMSLKEYWNRSLPRLFLIAISHREI